MPPVLFPEMPETVPPSPYLSKPWIDGLFILAPPFLCLLIVMAFPEWFPDTTAMPVWTWVVLVMSVDVAHVYSTLYRTYLATDSRKRLGPLLWVVPVVAFGASVVLYSLGAAHFWRVLAYLAVYHFIKQQYGFLRLYSRHEPKKTMQARLEFILIYAACLYPLLYWHLSGPRHFHWFMEGDFWYIPLAGWLPVLGLCYTAVWVLYLGVLANTFFRKKQFNVPKFLLLSGTAVSWYVGIVVYNGDLAFTLFNVICHGIPYMALVWIYNRRKYGPPVPEKPFWSRILSWKAIPTFIALLLLLAYAEEWLWDRLVWQEHESVFGGLHGIVDGVPEAVLIGVVPLLSLPQITHYILDGFIWKRQYLEVKL